MVMNNRLLAIYLLTNMPRAGGYVAALPVLHLTSKREFDPPSLVHDISVLEPILCPILAVDFDGLDIIAVKIVEAGSGDP